MEKEKEEEEDEYKVTESTPKEEKEMLPEKDEVPDLDELPGYIVTFEDEGVSAISQEYSSEENGELNVFSDVTLRESEENQNQRDDFKDPDLSFGLFKPVKLETSKTSSPAVEEENAEPESPNDIFQPGNQDLTLPGFEPSVAVPFTPVNPVPVSSLPMPEPELGSSGFPKLKQGRYVPI